MRREMEVRVRAELVHTLLAEAVALRSEADYAPEQDLDILSLLDQLETLLWVLEPEQPLRDELTH